MPLELCFDFIEEQKHLNTLAPHVEKQQQETDALTLVPKRVRSAVSMRADDTDRWGQDLLDEKESYDLTLRASNLKNEFLNRLNTFRRNRELCDVVLFVREHEIFAHKVVLAAISPALFDMFNEENHNEDVEKALSEKSESSSPPSSGVTSGGQNGKNNRSKGNMPFYEFAQSDYECFEALVDFAYTAYLEIRSVKVPELYKTAFALGMTPVIRACANFLADNLQVKNCIGIRRQANFQNDTFLLNHVDKFIQDNFEKIVNESNELKQIPVVQTRIIIPNDEEKIKDTTQINTGLAEMALKYFQNIRHDRPEQAIDLLTCKTHILYIDADHLTDCLNMDEHSGVGNCDIIQDYKKSGKDRKDVAKAMDVEPNVTHIISHRVSGAVAVRLNASRMQDLRSSNESLDSAGTDDSDPQETIEAGVIAIHRTAPQYWVALVVLYRRLCVLSLQLTENEELLRQKNETSTPTETQKNALLSRLITFTGKKQIPLANMSAQRCSIGASFLNGKIFVCGGYDRGECLKSVEEYEVSTGIWRNLASMGTERGRFDCAVNNGKIYAVAGSNGNNDLKSAELYDPTNDKWQPLPDLDKARCHNGCASLEDYVYCIGGSSDQVVLKDCERYNTNTASWEPIAPLENARYQAAVCQWKGFIIAAGGCDRWSCMDSVEAYDPKTNTWHQLAKLRQARRGCAVAVLNDALFVIGGHDGTHSLDSVEILDSISGTWRPGPALMIPRANTHAIATNLDVIFVLGGFNGVNFLDSIELIENEKSGWRNWQQNGELENEENVQNNV